MTAQPQWESVDDETHDLLALVAMGSPATPAADEEWALYVRALRAAAYHDNGLIYPNRLRPMVRGQIAPRRISAFSNAARAAGLVVDAGEWQVSDDAEGRNGGKPCRVLRWIGGDL